MSTVAVVDYGMGNVGSLLNAIKKNGHEGVLSSSEEQILQSHKIILPGVGSFDKGIAELRKRHLDYILEKAVFEEGIPLLGICLGMQLLGGGSEEGTLDGLA